MGDVVDLKPVHLEENHAFVADCCRFQEGILSEANMKRKYGFADNVWQDLGSNEALLAEVEEEKIRRVRSGRSKREKAQLLVVKAPDVVAKIMLDDNANPRHRIDAAASLDKFAANPADNTPATLDRFIIRIDLSGGSADHVEVYDKSISINADDVAPNESSTAPLKPATIADKRWDEGDVVTTPVEKG